MTTTPIASQASYLGANPGAERVYDTVQMMAAGLTLQALQLSLWNTIEDFALRSGYFRNNAAPWAMPVNVTSIDFNPYDSDWLVSQVLNVSGLPLYHVNPPAELVDEGLGTTARSGKADLILKPVSFYTSLPSEMWSTWFETLVSGTCARLFSQPARPYSNPQMAALHQTKFNVGVSRARARSLGQNAGTSGRWQFPLFASGRRHI